ncbi:hypothetical protein PHYBOEH_008260 [Phytophthora boehmeriae]|uniref:BZIP domain-containing protein n=1 Tax=Phytophthora boehmeriae TaxID=109152 RepID=A0A8T1W194_9STRA|nr:hypothetical protein PHYBOEH_008260 [Phytophthora boehmeriae]
MVADHSVLYPPNCQWLSNNVISEVIQRTPHRYRTSDDSRHAEQVNTNALVMTTGLISQYQHLASTDQATDAIQRRRERNRRHQARYKLKQKEKEEKLKVAIQALRAQIPELEMHHRSISTNRLTNSASWSVAAEYFRLFCNGFQPPEVVTKFSETTGTVTNYESHKQLRFLQETMMSDVLVEKGCGIETLLEEWRMFSLCHNDMDIQLSRIDIGAGDSLVAYTESTFGITEQTLQFAFPHLADENSEGKWSPFGEKLLGQQLVIHGTVRFDWDSKRRRVSSVKYQADMLTALLQLLGNLEDVAHVLGNARVTPEQKLVA